MSEATIMDRLPKEVSGRQAPMWWGMVFLIVTEATLFLYLLASYFNLRFHNAPEPWPLGGLPKPDLVVPAINTLILLSSSLPMHWADAGIRHGNLRNLKLGLALSFVLGATFLAIQIWGATKWTFTPATNAYASIFITTTTFHAAHLVIALVISGVIQFLAWLGYFNAQRHVAVQATALYWHFVDGIWIAVFATLQVSPYVL